MNRTRFTLFSFLNQKLFVSCSEHPSADVMKAQEIEAGAAGLSVPGCAGIRGLQEGTLILGGNCHNI